MTSDHNDGQRLGRRKMGVAAALATVLSAAHTFSSITFPGVSAQVAAAIFSFTAQRGIARADTTIGKANSASGTTGKKGWVELHRPDGGVVHIKVDQIVFVTSAAGTGSATRANSHLQLLNGFFDVRESVDEVMRAIRNDPIPVL